MQLYTKLYAKRRTTCSGVQSVFLQTASFWSMAKIPLDAFCRHIDSNDQAFHFIDEFNYYIVM